MLPIVSELYTLKFYTNIAPGQHVTENVVSVKNVTSVMLSVSTSLKRVNLMYFWISQVVFTISDSLTKLTEKDFGDGFRAVNVVPKPC